MNSFKKYIVAFTFVLPLCMCGVASAAVTPMPPVSNSFAVVGEIVTAASLNTIAQALNVLDERTNGMNPTDPNHLADKEYVDAQNASQTTSLTTAFTNAIAHAIQNVVAPVDNNDAANKEYVDTENTAQTTSLTTAFTNAISHAIQNVVAPVDNNDAANKGYVDGIILALPLGIFDTLSRASKGSGGKVPGDAGNLPLFNLSNLGVLGNIGVGVASPIEKVDIAGSVKIADTASVCDAAHAGSMKYVVVSNVGDFMGCIQTGSSSYAWRSLTIPLYQ